MVPICYTTNEYYDVAVERLDSGFAVSMEKKPFDVPVTHTPEEYDFPDKLYAEWWQDAGAWGIVEEGKLVAVIETCPETWSNRLRVTELWVEESRRRRKIGHALMELAKIRRGRRDGARLYWKRSPAMWAQSAFICMRALPLLGLIPVATATAISRGARFVWSLAGFPRRRI